MNNVSIQKLIKLQKNLMIIGIIIVIFGLFGGGIINYIIATLCLDGFDNKRQKIWEAYILAEFYKSFQPHYPVMFNS